MLILVGLCLFFLVEYLVGYQTLLVLGLGVIYGKFYWDGSENNTSRRWHWFQDIMGDFTRIKSLVDYKIVYHDDVHLDLGEYLSGEKSAIFSASPHSTISIGSFYHTMFEPKWRRGVTLCIHHLDFAIPLLREFFLWCGMTNVTKENIERSLASRNSVYVVIGGTREMMSQSSDTIHQGLLQIAFDQQKMVFPVLHRGQENIIKCYTTDWLDQYVRKPMLGWTGYAFPSLFLPQRGQMTTHIYQPLDPGKYVEASQFISDYYQTVKKYEKELSQREKQQ